jgi:hypothetical protein
MSGWWGCCGGRSSNQLPVASTQFFGGPCGRLFVGFRFDVFTKVDSADNRLGGQASLRDAMPTTLLPGTEAPGYYREPLRGLPSPKSEFGFSLMTCGGQDARRTAAVDRGGTLLGDIWLHLISQIQLTD